MTEWRHIPSAPGYAASSDGDIRRLIQGRGTRCRILRQNLGRDGYHLITLSFGSRQCKRTFLVSRLVCEAFHGLAPSPVHEAAHYDGNCTNNAAANLRWATKNENQADKVRHGSTKLTEAQVREIRSALAGNPRPTLAKLAGEYGVSIMLISNISRRKVWAWVSDDLEAAA